MGRDPPNVGSPPRNSDELPFSLLRGTKLVNRSSRRVLSREKSPEITTIKGSRRDWTTRRGPDGDTIFPFFRREMRRYSLVQLLLEKLCGEQPALFILFFFFFFFLFQKDYTRGVVNATEREKGKNGFCRLYRGLIAVDVTTNIVVPPLGQYRTSQERKRVVVARRIRLPILPMLIIPISIAGT